MIERRNLLKLFGVSVLVPVPAVAAALSKFDEANPPLLLGEIERDAVMTFRSDNLTTWGAGKGEPLTIAEVDGNFWNLHQRVARLEQLLRTAQG